MVRIIKSEYKDLEEILRLQYLAYQNEAALFGTQDIPPLRQTLDEVINEFEHGIILKMELDNGEIIGSVRAKEDSGTVYIGKLMVHPNHRHLGYGTMLLKTIENCFTAKRYELFTSTRSTGNIRLYQRNGYNVFDRKALNDQLILVYLEKNVKQPECL